MKIKRVSVLEFHRELNGKAWNPAFRWTERRAPLLLIETDQGVTGIGEAWSGYRGVEKVLATLIEDVCPALPGLELACPSDIGKVLAGLGADQEVKEHCAAWSAVDIALWDAFGHECNTPVWRLLGGVNDSAPAYASGGLYRDDYSLDDLYREALSYRARGFNAMKMKVAGLSLAEDLARVNAAREGLGQDAQLWVDGVNQLSFDSALSLWRALEPLGVSALQSPVPAHDVETLGRLCDAGVRVIASEGEHRHAELQRLVESRAVTHLQFCLPLCGGFSGAMRLDEYASAHGVMTTPQCFSTVVAQAASLHFAAARSNVITTEFHCYHEHLAHLFKEGVGTVNNGMALLGNHPGLGVCMPELGPQADGSQLRCIHEVSV